VNALWDAAPLVGDRITIVGAGMVGCAIAAVLKHIPGVTVELVDVDTDRAGVAAALGVAFARPDEAARARDLVFHASASSAGLTLALELLVPEGTVIELSWYGDREVHLPLGAAFHSRRLSIRASQVGALSPVRRANRTFADRLGLALELLRDDSFDALFSGESRFEELPDVLAGIAAGTRPALAHRISYGA
jgi:threonine dehydrogenase-like Zn-dependent dehydrogenase